MQREAHFSREGQDERREVGLGRLYEAEEGDVSLRRWRMTRMLFPSVQGGHLKVY